MTDTPTPAPIPADDPVRTLTVATPDDADVAHVAVVGDTYSVLVTGDETAGGYCLIDMLVPQGGGPPPHRHDFEELFTVLEGEIELTFRGETLRAGTGTTVNIPANAPHSFTNARAEPARLLCMCAPAGQEAFFLAIGDRVATRTSPPPELTDEQRAERGEKAQALAKRYRTELLIP